MAEGSSASSSPSMKRKKLNEENENEENESSGRPEEVKIPMPVQKLRKFKKIPVVIVEYHHEVLEFIYRCFGSRHLPIKGNILIHFDSHPDMVISKQISATEAIYDKDEVLKKVSIENWIMPGCYAGYYSKLIWLKNSWCEQIPENHFEMKIGDIDDKIYCNLALSYFISEANYAKSRHMKNAKSIDFRVLNADTSTVDDLIKNMKISSKDKESSKIILDIDLDFFSVSDPFRQIYEDVDCYNTLQEIFSYDEVSVNNGNGLQILHPEDICRQRKKQLDSLKEVFNYLETNKNLYNFSNDKIPTEKYNKLLELVDSIKETYQDSEIDWMLINDIGLTSDHGGLPYHISTENEIQEYVEKMEQILLKLPFDPTIITISRSSEDNYCPEEQVEEIQKEVMKMLERVFSDRINTKPIAIYEQEEWDVMEL